MTTPIQPQTVPTPTRSTPQEASLTPAGRASQALTGRGSGATPRRLRLARLVHVLLALVLGVGAVITGAELNERDANAAVHAAQYERATSIEASLQEAHESAGEQPTGDETLPAETQGALDTATATLIEMANAGTDDADELALIGQTMARYAQALAADRPTLAEQILTDDLLPAVQQVQAAHNAVASTAVTWWMWLVPVGAWLAVATIVGIAWYTARVSRRVVNPGLLVAAIATISLAVRSGSVLAGYIAGAPTDAGFLVLAVAATAISAVAGAWGLHQRLKEYR